MKLATFLLTLTLLSTVYADSTVTWYTSFDRAVADAQKSSKPIFVDVWAEWCVLCHKLDQEVYSTPQFAKYMQDYIPVKLNAEDQKEGTRFVERLGIDGFPTLIVADSRGNVTNRIVGYLDADALIKDIDGIQRLVLNEKKRPGDIETSSQLAHEYLKRDMYADAESRFATVLASPAASQKQKEEAQFSIALAQYYQHRLQQALDSLEAYQKEYRNGASEEDSMLLLSQIEIEMDATTKARETLKQFMQKFPKSENVARAQQVLDLLEKDLN